MKKLKLKKISSVVALALAAFAVESNATPPILYEDAGTTSTTSSSTTGTDFGTTNAIYYYTRNIVSEADSRLVQGYSYNNTLAISNVPGVGIKLNADSTAIKTSSASDSQSSDVSVTSSALSSATATSSALVGGTGLNINIITNTNSITAGTGIQLRSIAQANATASSTSDAWANNNGSVGAGNIYYNNELPTSISTATVTSTAGASILGNRVTNNGTVIATDVGIHFLATADSANSASATATANRGSGGNYAAYSDLSSASPSASASLTSTIDNNSISNSGLIAVSNGHGIKLEAVSGYNSTSVLRSRINTNTWTLGTGVINTYAYIDNNTITNTNLIYAKGNGINITANSYSQGGGSQAAEITNNKIYNNYVGWDDETNTAKGRIVANNTGINVVAATVNGNRIDNSGLIVSDPGMSVDSVTGALTKSSASSNPTANANFVAINIHGAGAGNTLNLNAPSYLAGRILLSNGTGAGNDSNTTVNLTSGYSHSNVWSIQNDVLGVNTYGPAAVHTYGPLPWFVRTDTTIINGQRNNTYATIDPTALTARPNMIADLSDSTHTLMANNITKDLKAAERTWLAGQMGTNRYDPSESSPTMDQKTNLYTVALGHDQTVGDKYRVGMMIGYNRADLNTGSLYSDLYANSYKNSTTGGFASIYANTKVDLLDIDAGLSAGIQRHTDTRFVNDNLKWWGISYANSKYDSQWVSPSIKVGLPIALGSGFSISPNVQVAYTYHHVDSYTETGSNSNASFGSQDLGVVESKVALDLTQSIDDALKATVTVGYLNRDVVSGDSVRVTMIGDTHDVQSLYETHNAGFVRGGLRWDITDELALNLAGTYMQGSRSGTNGGNGNLTLQYKF